MNYYQIYEIMYINKIRALKKSFDDKSVDKVETYYKDYINYMVNQVITGMSEQGSRLNMIEGNDVLRKSIIEKGDTININDIEEYEHSQRILTIVKNWFPTLILQSIRDARITNPNKDIMLATASLTNVLDSH